MDQRRAMEIFGLEAQRLTQAPARAEVSAVRYYRPDGRFASDTNAARIALAQQDALERGSERALAPCIHRRVPQPSQRTVRFGPGHSPKWTAPRV